AGRGQRKCQGPRSGVPATRSERRLERASPADQPCAGSVAAAARGRCGLAERASAAAGRRARSRLRRPARRAKQTELAGLRRGGVGDGGRVVGSDVWANEVFVFDAEGTFARSLDGTAGWMPGAIAAYGARIYVADAANGAILVFDDFALQGELAGWRGPVTAL